jgi:hypothetical protein
MDDRTGQTTISNWPQFTLKAILAIIAVLSGLLAMMGTRNGLLIARGFFVSDPVVGGCVGYLIDGVDDVDLDAGYAITRHGDNKRRRGRTSATASRRCRASATHSDFRAARFPVVTLPRDSLGRVPSHPKSA